MNACLVRGVPHGTTSDKYPHVCRLMHVYVVYSSCIHHDVNLDDVSNISSVCTPESRVMGHLTEPTCVSSDVFRYSAMSIEINWLYICTYLQVVSRCMPNRLGK